MSVDRLAEAVAHIASDAGGQPAVARHAHTGLEAPFGAAFGEPPPHRCPAVPYHLNTLDGIVRLPGACTSDDLEGVW
ncbi:MAG: hypothetical protein ACUVWR_11800 [Anaerolineae bacterium]